MKYTTFVGLDVHKNSISIAVIHAELNEAEFLGVIPNTPDAIKSLVKKLGTKETYYCYEAGPCGFVIYRHIVELGASCLVAAPSLIPSKPGDRVKTDKRDAKKLARLLKNGDLTAVNVPSKEQEAFRDLTRAREDAGQDLLKKRNQLTKFLLRLDIRQPNQVRAWSVKYRKWLNTVRFEELSLQIVLTEYIHAVEQAEERLERFDKAIVEAGSTIPDQKLFKAYQALKGVGLLTAATLIAEIGDITRFKTANQLMAYLGLIPGEHSSGDKRKQGRITKTGNAHLRYLLVENSWHYQHKPNISENLRKRQEEVSKDVKEIAWKAQHRLYHKYRKIVARGRKSNIAVVAVARELTGFIWAIGQQVNKERLAA
jgi:transposase